MAHRRAKDVYVAKSSQIRSEAYGKREAIKQYKLGRRTFKVEQTNATVRRQGTPLIPVLQPIDCLISCRAVLIFVNCSIDQLRHIGTGKVDFVVGGAGRECIQVSKRGYGLNHGAAFGADGLADDELKRCLTFGTLGDEILNILLGYAIVNIAHPRALEPGFGWWH